MGDDGLAFLDDVVVLDLGDEATALAGEYLAELGATVVRVEDERGDVLRGAAVRWHAVHNAGKRSVAIDTTTDDGWATHRAAARRRRRGDRADRAERRPPAASSTASAELGGDALGVVDVVFRRERPASRSPT